MNELVKVDESGKTTARELYEFLEFDSTHYSKWCKSNILENQFAEENKDYEVLALQGENPQGGRPSTNYLLSIDFAKKLCMVSKSPKGEQARNYFIEVEKRYKVVTQSALPHSYAEALRELAATVEQKEALQIENAQSKQIIQELRPKATYYDLILQNKSLLPVTKIAKDYGMSGYALNALLHELGIQYKMGDTWLLYQKHADKGYTQSKTHVIDDTKNAFHTYWTQAGRLFIYAILKSEKNILPLIERESA